MHKIIQHIPQIIYIYLYIYGIIIAFKFLYILCGCSTFKCGIKFVNMPSLKALFFGCVSRQKQSESEGVMPLLPLLKRV